MFDRLDYGVQAITQVTILSLPRNRMRVLFAQHPGIARTWSYPPSPSFAGLAGLILLICTSRLRYISLGDSDAEAPCYLRYKARCRHARISLRQSVPVSVRLHHQLQEPQAGRASGQPRL
jgi:hypothetical protein